MAGMTFGQINNEAIIEQSIGNNQGEIVQTGITNQASIGQGKLDRMFERDDREPPLFDTGTANGNEALV